MKATNYLFLVIFLLCSGLAYGQTVIRKAVFILVDGIPADVIEQVHTPHLDVIAREGGYIRAYVGGRKGTYSESPTISAVGYNSMLTGTWANKHNVWGNSIKNPNYNYWTIFRFFEEQYPKKETAIFSTWLDNRTKLVGEGLAATGNIQLDYHFDGFEHDTVQFPHDEDRDFIRQIDEYIAQEAARYLQKEGPDLSWVYLEYPDDMGHRYGDGERMNQAVELADEQIGKIWQAIQERERKTNEEWLIIVTTDHGRDEETGKDHGGQSERERTTWITTNAENLNDYFREHQPAIVDIMPTLADFLDIGIPPQQAWEIDGVSFIDSTSLIKPSAQLKNQQIKVSWKALDKEGLAKIWVSTTNDFHATGSADKYTMVGKVALEEERFVFDVSDPTSALYKVVVEGPHNSVSYWVTRNGKPNQ